MPGSIQSIERAAAVLRLLGGAGRPLALVEVAAPLDLPRPTAHGILRTLRDVGFVDQDRDTGRYSLGAGLRQLHGGWDGHELRSRAMNWADSLAGSSGHEVLLGMPASSGSGTAGAEVVHHVSGPTARRQRLRTGQVLPLHASAVGSACWRSRPSPFRRCTSSTCSATRDARSSRSGCSPSTSPSRGTAAGRVSWGSTGRASAGSRHRCAPAAGWSSGRWASRVRSRSLQRRGVPVPRLVEQLANAAREISAGLEVAR